MKTIMSPVPNFLKKENFREALINLFKILNEKIETRDKYLNEKILSFSYVNGGLFKEIDIISQPVIARLERGTTSPQLDTVVKLLATMGKKLEVVPI